MVAPTQHDGPASQTADTPQPRPRRAHGGLRRILASTGRLADLQFRLWLTLAKITLLHMALYVTLFAASALLGILAIVFLCIGAFHVLTDVLQLPVWASFLIFGAALAILAAIILTIATRLLTGGQNDALTNKAGDDVARPRNKAGDGTGRHNKAGDGIAGPSDGEP